MEYRRLIGHLNKDSSPGRSESIGFSMLEEVLFLFFLRFDMAVIVCVVFLNK